MKGIVNFLEKAGLVKMDEPVAQGAPEPEADTGADFTLGPVSSDPAVAPGDGTPLDFNDIYAQAGVSA